MGCAPLALFLVRILHVLPTDTVLKTGESMKVQADLQHLEFEIVGVQDTG